MPAVKKRKKAEPDTVCAYDSRFRSYEGFAVR